MPGKQQFHRYVVEMNTEKFFELLGAKPVKQLYYELLDKYGLDMGYTTFMSCIQNEYTWKLMYAWVIADYFNVSIYDLFELRKANYNQQKN